MQPQSSLHPVQLAACKLQEKHVGYDSLEGKVGRIYMPKQDLNSMALNKMKVVAH